MFEAAFVLPWGDILLLWIYIWFIEQCKYGQNNYYLGLMDYSALTL